jgi:hypothetical protein
MDVTLPKKCFVSHSYRDAENKRLLLNALPSHVQPFVFPAIMVTPDQMVTNDLIRSILECDGVVYINGGLSAQSFWVAFERDFAKRANLPVFEFDPTTSAITRDTSPPLHLPVFPSYAIRDRAKVDQILACMRDERYFDVLLQNDLRPGVAWPEELGNAISSRLQAGGYVVAFVSASSVSSQWVRLELESAARDHGDRIILAWLDRPGLLPEGVPVPLTSWPVIYLSFDEKRLNWNEVDRLIVMLYWAIYRNTRTNGLH